MQLTFGDQLKGYRLGTFREDLIAGLTVAVMLIPQGMAYALLAGLPEIYGLYAALVPMIVYPFFGSSRHLSVGPVALVSIIVFAGLSEMASPMSPEYIELAILTALVAGFIQLVLAIFKMGFLVNFLSHPVISGFTSAAAFIIAISQLKYLLGVEIDGSQITETLTQLAASVSQTNPISLMVGLGALAVILIAKRISKAIPGALIAVIAAIILVSLAGWGTPDLSIVEDVPRGLPAFQFPVITWSKIVAVTPLAFIICLISFIESLAIAKTLSAKHDNYPISANKELLGLGLAKIVGSFFLATPNTGSFTRSAINDQVGAKTGISSIIAALFVGLTLLFFTGLFYNLPHAVLAAIVISAVFGLIDFKGAYYLFQNDRRDFWVWLATFGLTLFFGIQQGVFTGIILSVVFIIYKASKPHYAILGNLPDTQLYRNVGRYNEAVIDPQILMFRYDYDIFYANAEHFYETVLNEVNKKENIKYLILDASTINHIDSTGFVHLKLLKESLDHLNIQMYISRMKGPLRDHFEQHDMGDLIAVDDRFLTNEDALTRIEKIENGHHN